MGPVMVAPPFVRRNRDPWGFPAQVPNVVTHSSPAFVGWCTIRETDVKRASLVPGIRVQLSPPFVLLRMPMPPMPEFWMLPGTVRLDDPSAHSPVPA